MKTSIIRLLEDFQIKIGDPIAKATMTTIRRELCVDSPEKWEKFYTAWYQVTNDSPGNDPSNLPIRTK